MKTVRAWIPENFLKRLSYLIVALFIMAVGITIVIKANLGQSTFSGFAYTLSTLANIRIGTMLIYLNTLFFIMEVAILRKKFPPFQSLQIPVNLIFGELLNLFNYEVELFNLISAQAYPVRLVFMIAGVICLAIAVAFINHIDLLILPYEAIILLVSRVYKLNYRRFRTLLDLTLVSSSVLLTYGFALGITPVREGTAFLALSLGSMIALGMKFWARVLPDISPKQP